jgi:NAD(P)H-hydrate epimerase
MSQAEQVFSLPRLFPRRPASHKGDYGRVFVLAGSPGMAGAAALSARAALRAGSGLVTVAIERSLSDAVTTQVPEATQVLLPAASADFQRDLEAVLGRDLLSRFQALAAGPGLGARSEGRAALALVLGAFSGPQVLDADALNLVAAGLEVPRSPLRVWTPHPGELRRLTGESPETETERVEASARLAAQRGGVVVLKGHRSVVHDGQRYFVNLTGNPGMATGGAGDVLTGVIASLLAQGLSPFDAACLGVYLHGRAGDIAARKLSEPSLIASDIVEALPAAFGDYVASYRN